MLGFCLLAFFTAGSFAAARKVTKMIPVTYQNIKLFVDGKQIALPEEPFLVEGKGVAMVPIRVISEALGKEVTWDEETSSIFIGKPADGELNEKVSRPKATPISQLTVLRNVGPFYELKSRNLMIAGRKFAGGVAVELAGESQAEAVLELKGQYSSMEGFLGVDDETSNSSNGFRVTIFGDEIEKYTSHVIKPSDYPYYVKIDVRGVKRLKIRLDRVDIQVGEYDKVIAALADFKFFK